MNWPRPTGLSKVAFEPKTRRMPSLKSWLLSRFAFGRTMFFGGGNKGAKE